MVSSILEYGFVFPIVRTRISMSKRALFRQKEKTLGDNVG